MDSTTVVEIPDLTMEMVREKFVVVDIVYDVSYETRTHYGGPEKTVYRWVYPVYSAPGPWRTSGQFTGVLWDYHAKQFVGYDEEFGENRCEGWPEFVAFVEKLFREGRVCKAYLAERTDEGDITINELIDGEWSTRLVFHDEPEADYW